MSHSTNNPSRRDFLKSIGGVLGGISVLGHGFARGHAFGSIPNGYTFYRVLTANEGGTFGTVRNDLGNITSAVMMASPLSGSGLGYVYIRGTTKSSPGSPGVFAVVIDFDSTPPVVHKVWDVAVEGRPLDVAGKRITVGHLGTGASNARGEYVTTVAPAEPSATIAVDNSPGVYLFRPSSAGAKPQASRMLGFADQVPDGSFYGGDFGDVALDDDQNLLLVAATTQSPDAKVSGFSGSQALIATSLAAPATGRVVLQTGDMLTLARAGVESVGLIDLASNHAFAAQLTARRLDTAGAQSGTALVVGNTLAARAEHKIVAASPELMSSTLASQHDITSGHTFFGPRVDQRQDVAFVTHVGTFQNSVGSNELELLGYYSRGMPHQLLQTKSIGARSNEVIGVCAPCIDRTGLMYGTWLLADGTNQLFISDGENSEVVLQSKQRVRGRAPDGELMVTEILFGHHSTQVDAFGRLAFTAEFLLDPSKPLDPANVITALVIGIPG